VKSTAGAAERHQKEKKEKKWCAKRQSHCQAAADGPATNVSVQQERSECI